MILFSVLMTVSHFLSALEIKGESYYFGMTGCVCQHLLPCALTFGSSVQSALQAVWFLCCSAICSVALGVGAHRVRSYDVI